MVSVKVTIRCNDCGKEFAHIGSVARSSDRGNYTAWAQKNVTTCPACYAAYKRAQAAADAAASAAEFVLPALEGTEKQIAWAESLRNVAIKNMVDIRSKLVEDEQCKFTTAIVRIIAAHTDAAYWIDNRNASRNDLIKLAVAAYNDATA